MTSSSSVPWLGGNGSGSGGRAAEARHSHAIENWPSFAVRWTQHGPTESFRRPARVSKQSERDPYRGRDPRQIPAYTLVDAARYLHIPARTIQNWAYGYPYATKTGGRRRTPPLIEAE